MECDGVEPEVRAPRDAGEEAVRPLQRGHRLEVNAAGPSVGTVLLATETSLVFPPILVLMPFRRLLVTS